jgi:thiol:disulfide interchange protein DsbD
MVMGLAFTATSFTCTVQFVGTLLLAALVGQILWPVLGMLVFSTVFALPFFLLALFPRYVMALRGRSGPWLVQLKVILGILELFIAFKFVSNADLVWQWGLFDRELLLALGAGATVLSALLLLGLVPWPGFQVRRLGVARLGWGAALLLMAVYFVRGAQGVELDPYTEAYLPPALGSEAMRAESGEYLDEASVLALPWNPTLDAALAQAQRSRKPIFVDFTGYTCINCRWMEKKVFAEKSVYQALRERFVLARLFTDGGEHAERNQRLQVERFRTLALPYYVILAPDNSVLAKHAGIMPDASDFLAWLEQGERMVLAARGTR